MTDVRLGHAEEGFTEEARGLTLWIVNQYAQRAGQAGITRHSTLARLMSARGVRTTIFASDSHYWNSARRQAAMGEQDPLAPDFELIRTPRADTNGARRVWSMLSFAVLTVVRGWRVGARAAPDVVLGSSPHPFAALAAWILARRHRATFVLEVRDIWPKSLVTLLGTPKWHPFVIVLAVIERFLYSHAETVVTLLPGSEVHIRSICPSVNKVVCVPNGVDVAASPSPGAAVDGDDFVAMYAGAHGIPNSLDTLIRAAAIVEERDRSASHPMPVMRVVLVGDGKEKGALQQLASELGVRNVEFRDPVPKSEIPELLATADVLILTLLDSPVFRDGISPNKLFDYMAAERPIIMSVDTPLDPVQTAGAGLTVRPSDPDALAGALEALRSASSGERAAMGARGRAYVTEHHDLARLADRLADTLYEVGLP